MGDEMKRTSPTNNRESEAKALKVVRQTKTIVIDNKTLSKTPARLICGLCLHPFITLTIVLDIKTDEAQLNTNCAGMCAALHKQREEQEKAKEEAEALDG